MEPASATPLQQPHHHHSHHLSPSPTVVDPYRSSSGHTPSTTTTAATPPAAAAPSSHHPASRPGSAHHVATPNTSAEQVDATAAVEAAVEDGEDQKKQVRYLTDTVKLVMFYDGDVNQVVEEHFSKTMMSQNYGSSNGGCGAAAAGTPSNSDGGRESGGGGSSSGGDGSGVRAEKGKANCISDSCVISQNVCQTYITLMTCNK